MEDNDDCEVRDTSGKCLVPSLCRAHPQDSDENKEVRSENDHIGKGIIENCHNEEQHLINSDIRASKT
jgi:hypothetical protein